MPCTECTWHTESWSCTAPPTAVTADGSILLVDVEQSCGPGRIVADLVLSAIGIEVDTALANSAGAVVDGGEIAVGEGGATSNLAVRAAGNGIRLRRTDRTLQHRSEHWEPVLLSDKRPAASWAWNHRPPSWFWTDRYGVHVEAVGSMSLPGATILCPGEGARRLAFRVASDGRLVGCAAIDSGKALRAARRLILRGAKVGTNDLLADLDVDLRKLGR